MARPKPRRRTHERAEGIADAFLARRHQLGLTQLDLAYLAGVSRASVQTLETGGTVRLGTADAIAEALGAELALMAKSGARLSG